MLNLAIELDESIDTDLTEMTQINSKIQVRFFTDTLSVLIDDYSDLVKAVSCSDLPAIQKFVWKYGVNAVYGVNT